jgi:flagellar biosynthetic protein FliR
VSDGTALVFARCAGFAFRAPGFSHPDVPPPVRAGFAFALALALSPVVAATARVPRGGFVFALASEALLGAAMGTAASLLYDGAFAGGRMLDDYVGIRASVPSAGVQAGAGFGRLWSLAFATAFFTLGGDRVALAAFADAFGTLPPGTLVSSARLADFGIALPRTLVHAALFVAGPAMMAALAMQIALATIGRVVPRFSTFALSFPLVFGCVLLATIGSLVVVLPVAARPWLDLGPLWGAP